MSGICDGEELSWIGDDIDPRKKYSHRVYVLVEMLKILFCEGMGIPCHMPG